MNIKKNIVFLFFIALAFCFSSCVDTSSKSEEAWQRMVDSGVQKPVNISFYSDLEFDKWLNENLIPYASEKYEMKINLNKIELSRIDLPKKDSSDNKLPDGQYDIIIVSADELARLLKDDALYGPFTSQIPKYSKYMSSSDYLNAYVDFVPIEGKAIPFYEKQVAHFYNSDLMFVQPTSLEELKLYMDENPDTILYPNPRSEAGKFFVQSVIMDFVDEHKIMEKNLSEAQVKSLVTPGLRYLYELNKNLYAKGKFMTIELEKLDLLFFNEVIHSQMSMNHYHADEQLENLAYPSYSKAFLPTKSSVTEVEYYAVIPKNAKNKSGAMIVLNEFLDIGIQRSLYESRELHGSIVYSASKLDDKLKEKLDSEFTKTTIVKPSISVSTKKSVMPEEYWAIVLNEWDKLWGNN